MLHDCGFRPSQFNLEGMFWTYHSKSSQLCKEKSVLNPDHPYASQDQDCSSRLPRVARKAIHQRPLELLATQQPALESANRVRVKILRLGKLLYQQPHHPLDVGKEMTWHVHQALA